MNERQSDTGLPGGGSHDGGLTGAGSTGALGVYVHFPYCRNTCGYCDFPKVRMEGEPGRRYADAVLGELTARGGAYRRRQGDGTPLRLRSIFFGGGTPSLWPARQLERVIKAVNDAFPVAGERVEVTVEANPETLASAQVLEGLLDAGVNRLSVGVQSLDDATLRALGRNHDAATARLAVARAREAGFDNLNLDLIFGVESQTVDHHLGQLRALLELEPRHVSTYALTLEPSVPLYRQGHQPADDDLSAEMMEQGRQLLEEAGLLQYEVSNFARRGAESVHNALVWAGQPYLGLGAWAHSLVPRGLAEGSRVANPDLATYLEGRSSGTHMPGATVEECDADRMAHEVLMLGLRTVRGVERAAFRRRFGEDPLEHRFGQVLKSYAECGIIDIGEQHIVPSRKGIWFADQVALALLSA